MVFYILIIRNYERGNRKNKYIVVLDLDKIPS